MQEKKTPKLKLAYKKTMRVLNVDADTGEIVDGGVLVHRQAKIKHYSKDYIIMFQEIFERIATDQTLKLEELRVLNFLLAKTKMENWVHLPLKEIALALGMQVPNVSRAMKKLLEKGLIEETVKMGRAKNYKISSQVGWRGTGESYRKATFLNLVKPTEE